MSQPRTSQQKSNRPLVSHEGLALIRTSTAEQMVTLLERAPLRREVVRQLDESSILVPRSARLAFEERMQKLQIPFFFATPDQN